MLTISMDITLEDLNLHLCCNCIIILHQHRKPNSRFEVLQLRRTMDLMLEKAGVGDVDVEIKGPTQVIISLAEIHRLISFKVFCIAGICSRKAVYHSYEPSWHSVSITV